MLKSAEKIEHHVVPPDVADKVLRAGGINRFNDPMFRLVWGYDRIVPFHGIWEEWESGVATLTDKVTGYQESRPFNKLKRSVEETRQLPKYLPGNCWHLEKWCPPEQYGTPENWQRQGDEQFRFSTIHTSGPYPERGEYELCFPMTDDGSVTGQPLPIDAIGGVIEQTIKILIAGVERFSYQQRRAAIEQRVRREEAGYVAKCEEILRDGMPAHHGNANVTVLTDKGEPVK